jgi:hypothetical protein
MEKPDRDLVQRLGVGDRELCALRNAPFMHAALDALRGAGLAEPVDDPRSD